MAPDAGRLMALAEAISDGRPIDWAAVDVGSTTAEDRDLVRHLRLLAGVADVHRSTTGESGDERVGSTWGALAIRERVGGGSFGAVYRAWDERLARDVALKLLHQRVGIDPAPSIIKEGRLLARVRHPHVITVYGADRFDGTVGLWMEFVEGRTLEQILHSDGQFGAREAALIGIDLCSALAAVHAQGLVHRDVKTQNVMREDGGRIVLMDFGAGQEQSTSDLRSIGTPAYMSPEVLQGNPATYASDLYSLGVVLFRLVTRRYPVAGTTVGELVPAHEDGRRLRLRDARPDLPTAFVDVVERALAPAPGQRYASAGEMQAALAGAMLPDRSKRLLWSRRRAAMLAVLAVLTVAVAGAGRTLWIASAPVAPVSTSRALAVRPLKNLSADQSQNFFAAGLTDVLIAHLGSLRGLRVVALTDPATDAAALKRLGMDRVLEGSVHRENGRVRMSARVVQADGGAVLWGKVYEGAESEAFALQARMAVDLARDLSVPVSEVESRRLARNYVVQREAQEAYLRGKYLLDSHTRNSLTQAREEFERAVHLEPGYAPALASLALTYLALGNFGVLTPTQVQALAPPAANAAYAADPTLAEAALAVADVRFRLFWDWKGAEQAYRDAIALNPSYTLARGQYARLLAAAGRTDEAMREAQDAYEIDPLSIDIHSVVGMMLYYDRRFDDAVTHFQSRIEEPSARSHIGLGRAASAAGRHAEAVPALRRAVQLSGDEPSVRAELARALAASGETSAATTILRDLEARRAANAEYIAPQDLAYVYIALARPDTAFALLNRAVEEHASRLLFVGVDPRMDDVRSDARFQQLVGRLGSQVVNNKKE